ncbi:MAG: hypothetical protein U0353_34835 [Sandaracinus sp.]
MSAYRHHDEPLESKRDRLARRLAQVREDQAVERGEREALDREEREILRALRALPLGGPRSRKPGFVWALRVVSPCTEDWNAMVGDARVRHCSRCDRDVYDLAEMTRPQIAALLEARGVEPCVRLRRRADGTLVTADACPPETVASSTRAGLAVATVAVAITTVAAANATIAREPMAEVPCRVDPWASQPRESHVVMGRMQSEIVPEPPRPPWEHPEVVEAGFESLAHFTESDRGEADDDAITADDLDETAPH